MPTSASAAEINGREVTIVGHFELGTGLTADGCILVNAMAFPRFVPTRAPEELSFGLVRLQDGADADAAARRMRRTPPPRDCPAAKPATSRC